MRPTTRILLALLPLLLAACSSRPTYQVADGAPDRKLDPDKISDAVPREEPRSRYGNPSSYVVFGRRYQVMDSSAGHRERGIASWYGSKFHGRRTSSGETYDMYAMTAAHKHLPLPTYVRVTNLRNNRSAVVKVNDRGPFHDNRVIDLSYAAATKLGILQTGTGLVEVTAIDPRQPEAAPPQIEQPRTTSTAKNVRQPTVFIQVGAFSSRFNADRLQQRLQQNIDQPVRIQQAARQANIVFRVQVGPIASVEQADDLSLQLAELGIDDLRIVIE